VLPKEIVRDQVAEVGIGITQVLKTFILGSNHVSLKPINLSTLEFLNPNSILTVLREWCNFSFFNCLNDTMKTLERYIITNIIFKLFL